jgi:hypothetical protein
MITLISDLFTARARSTKSSLSGPAAKRAKIEKKKMLERNNKGNGSKTGSRGKDSGDSRQKNFKSGRTPKSGGKLGFKGASKIQRKR